MAEGTLTSQTLQRFTELEELAEEIMEDKHQVRIRLRNPFSSISEYNLIRTSHNYFHYDCNARIGTLSFVSKCPAA